MRRALLLRMLVTIDVGSSVLANAISVRLACPGDGYWALVGKPVVAAVAALFGVWTNCAGGPNVPCFTPA